MPAGNRSLLAEARGLTILIAEDDRVSALFLRKTLERMGHEVLVAGDGEEAFRLFEERRPRLIISDWMMPKVDGVELCRKVRAQQEDTYVYFVLLTAKGSREHRIEGLQAGADDFLSKPTDVSELQVRVRVAARILEVQDRLFELARTEHELADRMARLAEALEEKSHALEAANARLAELSTTDGLTGLRNYRAFSQRLLEEHALSVRTLEPYSLILIDVDHFKQYNDSFGHIEGDAALRRVAEILNETVRVSDFVARYGGEEFVVLLPRHGATAAMDLAERIRVAVEGSEWPKRPITISLGAATWTPRYDQPSDLTNAADEALYHSKAVSRNCATHALQLAGELERK